MSERRTCREEKPFADEIDSLRTRYARIDKVHFAITWELSRNPAQVGKPLESDANFRIFHTNAYGDIPSFRVLYSYDRDTVVLWSIQPTGEESSPEA